MYYYSSYVNYLALFFLHNILFMECAICEFKLHDTGWSNNRNITRGKMILHEKIKKNWCNIFCSKVSFSKKSILKINKIGRITVYSMVQLVFYIIYIYVYAVLGKEFMNQIKIKLIQIKYLWVRDNLKWWWVRDNLN